MYWFVLLVVAVGVDAVNNFNNRFKEDANTTFLYTFQEGQTNPSATTSNSGTPGLGSIIFNTAAANAYNWLPSRQGVHVGSISGSVNSGVNRFSASSSGYLSTSPKFSTFLSTFEATFEIWLTPDNSLPFSAQFDVPYFIGNITGLTGTGICDATTHRQYFRVGHYSAPAQAKGGFIDGTFGNPTATNCEGGGAGSSSMSTTNANYYALTIRATVGSGLTFTSYFFDSVTNYQFATPSYNVWEPDLWYDGRIHLGAAFGTDPSFSGKIFMISMWSKALSAAQIAQNIAAGLPNSVPYYPLPSLNVSGFQQVDLPINLFALDYDGDPITYSLVTLPQLGQGTLYFGQGGTLTPAATGTSFNGLLTFRGDYLGYGFPYSTFKYQASDGIGASGYINVFVNISRVNQAPTSNDTSTSIRAGFYARVVLGGFDIDHSPGLFDAYIMNTGNSIQVFNLLDPTFQPGDDPTGKLSEITGYNGIAPSNANKVTTRLASDQNSLVIVVRAPAIQGTATNGQDIYKTFTSLKYKIADGEGTLSDFNATISVTVRNHLEAVFQNLTGSMDTLMTFNFTGRDYSSGRIVENTGPGQGAMIFRIRTLPQHGRLINPADGVTNYTTVGTGILLTPGYRTFMYQTDSFWSGNDFVGFDLAISGSNSIWKSAVTTDLLDLEPIFWQPEIYIIQDQTSVQSIGDLAHFQIDIVSHSEIYFPPTDLYLLRIEINPASYGSVSVPQTQASLFNAGQDGRQWANALFSTMDGTNDSPLIAAVGTLAQLRGLIFASDPNNPTDLGGMPYIQFSNSQPGIVMTIGVSICLFTNPSQLSGACPIQADVTATTQPVYPPSVVTFTVEYSGASENNVSGTLPVPALVFVWIGIGLVALGCYGCLFWRWWKNRRLQQRTRTNMAAGANASRYLHSL